MKKVYLGLDAHARNCVLGSMNTQGTFLDDVRFRTTESDLITHVVRIKATEKLLAVEEGPLAYWIAQTIRPYVSDVLICDPRKNKAISSAPNKNDRQDVYTLCRLLRLGELSRVYHPLEDHRAVFKAAVQQYLAFRKDECCLKFQIKSRFRSWGVHDVDGQALFSMKHRKEYLDKLTQPSIRRQLAGRLEFLDEALNHQRMALREAETLGRRYSEIERFRVMPGVGKIGSLIFDAYIQTPHRFASKQQLWKYCQLGITDRSSDGKPLGFKRLDKNGNSELKSMSYNAWKGSLITKELNAISSFFWASMDRTHNRTKARLNTQRKILAVLWTMWKNEEEYHPELITPGMLR